MFHFLIEMKKHVAERKGSRATVNHLNDFTSSPEYQSAVEIRCAPKNVNVDLMECKTIATNAPPNG